MLKCNIQIGCILRAGLEVRNAVFLSQNRRFLLVHLDFINQINFIPQQYNFSSFVCMFLNLIKPVVNVFEAAFVCHIVNQNYAHRPPEVVLCCLPVTFLTS